VILAALVLASECILVPPVPTSFFQNSRAVAFARFNGRTLIVEEIVRGNYQRGQEVIEGFGSCEHPQPGDRFLLSRNCRRGECGTVHAKEAFAPPLVQWLGKAHFETHETLLAKLLQWDAGRISTKDFRVWLETVNVRPRSEAVDDFTLALTGELRGLAGDLLAVSDEAVVRSLRRDALREVMRLARDFPRGTDEEFDARLDNAGVEEGRFWFDHEQDLLAAIEAASDAIWEHIPTKP